MTERNLSSITNDTDNKINKKRIMLYLIITFVITYVLELFVIIPLLKSVKLEMQMFATVLVASVMFIPAIGVLLTRLITKERFHNSYLKLNLKNNIGIYLFAWFGPTILSILGAIIYFLLFPNKFDPNLGYMQADLSASGQNFTVEQLQVTLFSQIAVGIVIAPILNFIACFGEEWGWRGYLLPKMLKQFKIVPVLLINGVIWGLWHAPLTAIGHNYGTSYKGFPYLGIIAMCLFCTIMGIIFSYITIKTKSCIPAVLAHGAINGFASIGAYFTIDGGSPLIGPMPVGIIGGIPFIIIAIIWGYKLYKKEKELSLIEM